LIHLVLVASTLALLPQDEEKTLADRLTFYANGRIRAESTFDQLNGKDRHRGRVRLRVGSRYEIMEGLLAEARLSTSSDGNDANSPYWDFGDGSDGFQGSDVVVDRFYVEYLGIESLDVRVGKFSHVYQSPPIYGEFVWDADVGPAGASAVWDLVDGDGTHFDLRGAGYVVQENGGDDDPNMLGVQGNLGTKLGESTSLHAASAVSFWGNLGDGDFTNSNQGNTTSGGNIDEDFTVWESFVSATHEGGFLDRQVAFVQYLNNLDTGSDDQGIAGGIELGTQDPGAVSFFVVGYDFDANAVFSPVAQDDTPIAGTGTGDGMKGVLGGVRYVVNDRLSFRLWALTSDADESEDPWRLRLDLDFKVK